MSGPLMRRARAAGRRTLVVRRAQAEGARVLQVQPVLAAERQEHSRAMTQVLLTPEQAPAAWTRVQRSQEQAREAEATRSTQAPARVAEAMPSMREPVPRVETSLWLVARRFVSP
jgi:hypothetical protein